MIDIEQCRHEIVGIYEENGICLRCHSDSDSTIGVVPVDRLIGRVKSVDIQLATRQLMPEACIERTRIGHKAERGHI